MSCLRRIVRRSCDERLRPDRPVAYRYYQECTQRHIFASRFVLGRDVLDIGCGTGYGTGYVATKGAGLVVGGDIDREAIRYARTRFPQARYVCADATRLPFRNESFDVVICFEVVEHVVDFRGLLSECRRVLRDEGVFICSTPNRNSHFALCRSAHHLHEFAISELCALLEEWFANVRLHGQQFVDVRSIGRKRWRTLMGTMGSAMLSHTPFGAGLKQLLSRMIFRDHRRMAFEDDLEASPDPLYAVVPLAERPEQVPTTVVAIARRPARLGRGKGRPWNRPRRKE